MIFFTNCMIEFNRKYTFGSTLYYALHFTYTLYIYNSFAYIYVTFNDYNIHQLMLILFFNQSQYSLNYLSVKLFYDVS